MGLLDQFLVDNVKKFEGYRENPYWDYKQYTSGYGTKAANQGEVIDRATAEQRLTDELSKASAMVAGMHPDMPAGVRNALTSLTFNAGPKWMNSGLGNAVREGNWEAAKSIFQQYNKAGGQVNPGLVSRRAQEASWFDGMPASGPAAPVQTAALAPPRGFQNPRIPVAASPGRPYQAPSQQAQTAELPPMFGAASPSVSVTPVPVQQPPQQKSYFDLLAASLPDYQQLVKPIRVASLPARKGFY